MSKSTHKEAPLGVAGSRSASHILDQKDQKNEAGTSTSSGKTELTRTAELILRVYELFGFKSEQFKIDNTVQTWYETCQEYKVSWLKLIKYKLAAFFSYWINEGHARWRDSKFFDQKTGYHSFTKLDLPPCPVKDNNYRPRPDILLGGDAHHWLTSKHSPRGTKFLEFLVTILTGVKKGAPRGSEEDAYKAELETIEKLCNQVINERSLTERWKALLPEVKREPTFEDFKLVINTMTRKSLETTEEDPKRVRFLIALYKVIESTFKTPYSDEDRFTPVLPSTNSTYKTTRKDGGAYGEFKADFGTYDTKELIDVSEVAEEKEFYEMRAIGEEKEKRKKMIDVSLKVDATALHQRWIISVYPKLLKMAIQEENLCTTVVLREALKYRVITRGQMARTMILKRLQKKMHSTMRHTPLFRYIGEWVDETKLDSDFVSVPGWANTMVSGDWSDATNELASFASLWCAELLSARLELTAEEKQLFIDSLINFRIQWGQHVFIQRNGQLMGSVTSFPVLCLINAAVCTNAYLNGIPPEIHQKEWLHERKRNVGKEQKETPSGKVEDAGWNKVVLGVIENQWKMPNPQQLPIRINGDDLLFPGTKESLKYLEKEGGVVNLKVSVGKAYNNENYANINSTSFICKRVNRGMRASWKFVHIPFVNFGLLLGMQRSGETDELATDYGSRARELVRMAPRRLRYELLIDFIDRNIKTQKDIKVPYHLPESVGGLGLPVLARNGETLEEFSARMIPIIKKKMELKDSEEDKKQLTKALEQNVDRWWGKEATNRTLPSLLDLRLAKAVLIHKKKVAPPSAASNWKVWNKLIEKYRMERLDVDDPRVERANSAVNCLVLAEALSKDPLSEVFMKNSQKAYYSFNSKLYNPRRQTPMGGVVKLTHVYGLGRYQTTMTLALAEGINLDIEDFFVESQDQ
jgi:hypothetical protein